MTPRPTEVSRRGIAACAMVIAVAVAPVATTGAAEPLLLAGGELADTAYYSYVGAVLPFGERVQGRGWFQRYWLDAFGYEYDGGPGRIQADALGVEGAVGYGGSSERGWWSTSVGVRYTDTSLDPDDRSASARGSQLGAKFQLEGEATLAPEWRISAIASYTNEQHGYWTRMRLMRGNPSTHAFGIEALAGGNDEADSTAIGVVTSFRTGPASPWTIGLKAGYRFQDDADGAYGGVELGYSI